MCPPPDLRHNSFKFFHGVWIPLCQTLTTWCSLHSCGSQFHALRVRARKTKRNETKTGKIRVIAVEFVCSIKTRQRLHSQAKRTYRVLARFTSLLFAMRISTVGTTYKKVTIITSTHILTLSYLRWKGLHFLLSRINKLNRDFFHWQFYSLVCPLKNHVTMFLSHQSLSACKDGGHRE